MNDRLLRRQQVEEITGLSRSSLYRLMAAGEFPRPVAGQPRRRQVAGERRHELAEVTARGGHRVRRAAKGLWGQLWVATARLRADMKRRATADCCAGEITWQCDLMPPPLASACPRNSSTVCRPSEKGRRRASRGREPVSRQGPTVVVLYGICRTPAVQVSRDRRLRHSRPWSTVARGTYREVVRPPLHEHPACLEQVGAGIGLRYGASEPVS